MTSILACQEPKTTAQSHLNDYFESIKNDKESLRAFLWAMPKGGDIHHHALGAVMAEDYLSIAIENNFSISKENYRLYSNPPSLEEDNSIVSINSLLAAEPKLKERIIDNWSMRNYMSNGSNGRNHFFDTFYKFEEAMIGHEPALYSKLCQVASEENIQYLETMVAVPGIMKRVGKLANDKEWQPGTSIKDYLTEWYAYYESQNIDHWAEYNAEVMDHWIEKTNLHGVNLKFQTIGLRILPNQGEIFGHLILAFKTANLSENVVGVNFVAPEDAPLAIENYDTHMAMFRFLKAKFPKVNLSLHAGELNPEKDITQNENATFHIDHAVRIAGAQRIGHGFDLRYESRKQEVLNLMKVKGVAVEINLETNEVILESGSGSHPLRDYLEAEVPVCISSDDPGILRSDLTNQFVLLTEYLDHISFTDIKKIALNSISYSFLEPNQKEQQLEELNKRFEIFEKQFAIKN